MSGFILSYPVGDAKSKNTKNYTSLSEMKSDKSIPDGTVGSVSEYGWVTMKEAKALEKVVNVPKLKDTGLAEDEIQYIDTNHLDFGSSSLMIYHMLGLGGPIYLFKSKEGDKVYLWYLETFFSRNRLGIGLRKVLANSTPLKKYETTLLILVSGINPAAMEDGMLEFNNAAAQQKDSKWFTLLFNELLKLKELSLWLDNHNLIYPKSDDLLKEYEEEAKLELIDSGIENVFRVPGLKNSTLYIKENGLWTNICNTHTYEDEETLLSSSAQNGDIGVTNNGTYIRANDKWKDIDSYKKVTWQELKDLRDGGKLNPGSLYRITDYQCTTTQENTQSAGHQFDIVLLALSENKLAEEGWAIEHPTDVYDVTFANGVTKKCYLYKYTDTYCYIVDIETKLGVDVGQDEIQINEENNTVQTDNYSSADLDAPDLPYNYFQNSKLEAWKVWYCLDNDKTRFAWADDSVDESSPATMVIERSKGDFSTIRNSTDDMVVGNTQYYAWRLDGATHNYYTLSQTPEIGDDTYEFNVQTSTMDVYLPVKSYTSAHEGTGLPNGRGVIYRLIDEFNNDIKYDFKNIQFMRSITDGQYDENGIVTWCYTLNIWYQDMCQDASIVGNTLPNDEGFVSGVYDNKFGYATANDLYLEGVDTFAFALGHNVVLSIDDGEYYGIHSNTIGNDFYSNTIGNDFYSNTIGNYFYSNKVSYSFQKNGIGNYFNSNTIGNFFYGNTIGNDFYYNTIGNMFQNNTIGNEFQGNTIGNEFAHNTIGNTLQNSTIGNSFLDNIIGNKFGDSIIGNYFFNNTIGNEFQDNTIGDYFYSNTIGNEFLANVIGTKNGDTVTTKDYVRYISVEDGVQYIDITTSATTSLSAYLQNIIIGKGVAGTYFSRKTITHPTVGDTMQTTYVPTNSTTVNV